MAEQRLLTEEELYLQQGLAGGGGAAGSNASSTITPAAGGSAGAPAPGGSQPKGSGWVNLQNYLDANAGQGTEITKRALSGADNQIKSAVDSINKTSTDTQNAIKSGTVQKNDQILSQLKADPSQVKPDEYRAYTNQTYKGPNALSDTAGYADISAQSGKAQNMYKDMQTKEGREVALQKSLNDPRYSRGMSFLDSYLMQQEGQQEVDAFAQRNKGIGSALTDAQKNVSDSAAAAASASAANVSDVRASALGEHDQLQGSAKRRLEEKNDGIFNEIFDYNTKNRDDLNKRKNEYGVDPRDFVVGGEGKYALGDVLSSSDRARMQALADMLGTEDNFSNANPSGRGGASFNEEAFKDALSSAKAEKAKSANSIPLPPPKPSGASARTETALPKLPKDPRAPLLKKDLRYSYN